MDVTKARPGRGGEFYEALCLATIAACLWVVSDALQLLPRLERLSQDYGASKFIFLGFFMSFAVMAASILKSLRLRHEMAARLSAEESAQAIARHDGLTGLANRRKLLETIAAAGRQPGQGRGGAVLLIDLDRFKPVNDAYGHAAGDAVLCATARRLVAVLPPEAVAARLGGDEFAAFLPDPVGAEELMRLAQQLISRLAEPVLWDGAELDVGATVGLAWMGHDGTDADAVLRAADIAMYRGKREGRGIYRFFEQEMDEELTARVSLECALRAAIRSGEIKPHYQPLVALPDNRLLGFEVLARWYHPERGVIPPAVFIPIAEDTGLISDLCYALLRQACRDAAAWPDHLQLAVNISPHQFKDKAFAQRILGLLEEAGFPPSRLELEITETALTSDLDVARAALSLLQESGISVALDDFGTGYSSLYHLREMKFDKIKIDRSFVQSLGNDQESAKIISAILGLGRSLGILTTAEGIENPENSAWLAAHGCTNGQGFLFGAPLPADAVAAFLTFGEPEEEQRRAA